MQMSERLIGFGILVVIGLTISQCTSADRNDAGQITKAGDVSVTDVQLGDCFDDLTDSSGVAVTLSSLRAVPCNEGHHWQVFHQEELTLSDYDEDSVSQSAEYICNQAADTLYANMSAIKFDAYQNANLSLTYPTYKSWTVGSDHLVGCLVGDHLETYYSSVFE
jgi:hypothetical protein